MNAVCAQHLFLLLFHHPHTPIIPIPCHLLPQNLPTLSSSFAVGDNTEEVGYSEENSEVSVSVSRSGD